MFGRIEMDSLWENFKALPESPGLLIRNISSVHTQINKKKFQFYYDFTGADGKKYLVIGIKGKTFVVDANNNKRIFKYRNPNQFKYFSVSK